MDRAEVGHEKYHISTHSGGGNCVAVARLASGDYVVRHSRQTEHRIVFTPAEWDAFIVGVKHAEFDF